MRHSIDHILPNPYAHLSAERREVLLSRLSADISYEDKEYLRRVFPAKGLFNRLTQIFFHSIVEELKQNDITTYTPSNADAVARLIARRCTITPASWQVHGGHDAGGVARESYNIAGNHQQSNQLEEKLDQQESGGKGCQNN